LGVVHGCGVKTVCGTDDKASHAECAATVLLTEVKRMFCILVVVTDTHVLTAHGTIANIKQW
jgi:hypothetical protein